MKKPKAKLYIATINPSLYFSGLTAIGSDAGEAMQTLQKYYNTKTRRHVGLTLEISFTEACETYGYTIEPIRSGEVYEGHLTPVEAILGSNI